MNEDRRLEVIGDLLAAAAELAHTTQTDPHPAAPGATASQSVRLDCPGPGAGHRDESDRKVPT